MRGQPGQKSGVALAVKTGIKMQGHHFKAKRYDSLANFKRFQ